jgi:hypothetical protein
MKISALALIIVLYTAGIFAQEAVIHTGLSDRTYGEGRHVSAAPVIVPHWWD